ncbi:MAG: DUF1467 family protein [Rickettsiales bacterium]|nr:DUF1467 family protein [Rickettsiales bacterium]
MNFDIVNFIFIYFITWWILIFCVLPFGLEKESQRDKNYLANSSAAPKNPNIKKKFLINSILSFFVAILIYYFWQDIFPYYR